MCLERYIVEQCAPTLASIKTGALFGVIDPDTEELLRQAEHWRERLAGKGLALRVLRCRPGKALIYLGRLSQLERDLASSGAAELLERCGYASHGCVEALETLRRRVLSSESFPHEIGLFLGYPLPDVLGYIQNRGKNSKLCGAWQVYGDAAEAERSFRRFRKCSELYKRRYNGGESLMQLTVSA